MVDFTIHDENTAPQDAAPALAQAKQNIGFIPNLYGVFAESPQAFHAHQALSEQFQKTPCPQRPSTSCGSPPAGPRQRGHGGPAQRQAHPPTSPHSEPTTSVVVCTTHRHGFLLHVRAFSREVSSVLELASGSIRPTLPIAWKSSEGRVPIELRKMEVTEAAMATMAHTG